jgi:hypothetical protein
MNGVIIELDQNHQAAKENGKWFIYKWGKKIMEGRPAELFMASFAA